MPMADSPGYCRMRMIASCEIGIAFEQDEQQFPPASVSLSLV
jgi:hypothetical protein